MRLHLAQTSWLSLTEALTLLQVINIQFLKQDMSPFRGVLHETKATDFRHSTKSKFTKECLCVIHEGCHKAGFDAIVALMWCRSDG